MESTPEATTKPRYAMDFTNMSPDDIVDIYQTIDGLTSDDQFDLQKEMLDAFYFGLDHLAQAGPGVEAAAYWALATSKETESRRAAAISIDDLARHDKYGAFPVWNTLLHDKDHSVRGFAVEAIERAASAGIIHPLEASLLSSLVIDETNT